MVRYIEVENRKGKILRGFLNLPDGVAHPPVVCPDTNMHIHIWLEHWRWRESHVCDLTSTDVGKVTESLMR